MPSAQQGGPKHKKLIDQADVKIEEARQVMKLVERNTIEYLMISGGSHPVTGQVYTQSEIDERLETWGETLLNSSLQVSAVYGVLHDAHMLLQEMKELCK